MNQATPKLLIVDDDPHIRRLLHLYLRNSPYEVYEAATGEEAIQLNAEHDFAVVLLDLILPYYGGFRLCQKFKGENGSEPPYVIIITGDDSTETRATAAECGADHFIGKPFFAEDLVMLIPPPRPAAVHERPRETSSEKRG
jgi:DNA-binding response OmpR family regulator